VRYSCRSRERRRSYDNAMAESFFATLECELIEHEGPFATQYEARLAVFDFIEGWYNDASYCLSRYVLEKSRCTRQS